MQVRVDAVQRQLGRVLVEGDLVGAVVRGDVDLEVAPDAQGDDHRGQDDQVDPAQAADGQCAPGNPGRHHGQQTGQAHDRDRDSHPRPEGQVAGQPERPGDEEDRCQRPQRPLGPGRGVAVSLAAAPPAGGRGRDGRAARAGQAAGHGAQQTGQPA